ncbi:Hsp20/alpha crystallin family protein [Halomonas sp. TRM85114]|uniref:Hsp20/alpha crystallin family protein n=1 Tax=Halomonas jincaotanensis TaxID=2810616 RepID=UPI001BD431CF|nr:Hsp20/alpha crystallin family protein [Halomonas jincaotanensis]MBS9405130.1 Hsp20/alpha crystallin family protein [Halomonas jincaotanensis]
MTKKKGKEDATNDSQAHSEAPPRGGSPLRELDRIIDSLFDRDGIFPMRWDRRQAGGERRTPRVDVIDRDTEVLLRAELPGLEREDLDVSVTQSTVTIKGDTHKESRDEKGDYHRSEIVHGTFSRTVALPSEINADKVEARFHNGILELTLPKLQGDHRRKVEVK